jgi:hypothetical protein
MTQIHTDFWGLFQFALISVHQLNQRYQRYAFPLTWRKKPGYDAHSMHASRFSFAFTYRYFFTGSGEADGVLMLK